MPIFIVVAIWTKLYNKLRCRILLTAIAGFFLYTLILNGNIQTEIEAKENTIDYVVDRDIEYIECIDNADDFDTMFDGCIVPFLKDLRDTYK